MILVPKCCGGYCRATQNPYMFKCNMCGKEICAELVISGRSVEEELQLLEEYRVDKFIKEGRLYCV